MARVAFQGERGAFSEDAATKLFGRRIDFVPCMRLKEAFELVSQDRVDSGWSLWRILKPAVSTIRTTCYWRILLTYLPKSFSE